MHNVIDINAHKSAVESTQPTTNAPPSRRSKLALNNISYCVNNKRILQDISFDLPGQGITAIMGFNGAGKSLLLKIMHGIVKPSSGTVLWNQQPSDARHRLSQAMVFQKPVLLRRSVKANIDFVTKQRGAHNPAARNALLIKVGLEHKASQPARLLSGGEQQRLALARALACHPDIVFLDEATASLDPASSAIIEQIVVDQASAGTKVIMVTHNAAQAARIADHVVFLDAGRVTDYASTEQFFNAPSSQAAAAYLEGRLHHPKT